MGYYRDLREYIRVLEENDKLIRIKREINKDTELMPLVRWEFRGLPEKERKTFLFENITDAKGKKYFGQVLVGSHAASRAIYAMAMATEPSRDHIMKKWDEAQLHPIAPVMVASGSCQEEVHLGDSLMEHGALEEFAIPNSTPGFDNAPYFSAGNWISKDPETGSRNVGNYRTMLKSPTRVGICATMPKDLRQQWQKYKAQGVPMPAAVVIGPTPNVGLVAVTQVPYGFDELGVAGGIAGEPIQLVKCKTVDVEVPATAEIVIEGEIPTDALEREGPFGEFTGYMGMAGPNLFLNVKCITHRKQPIWNAYLSQFPPSESSLMTQMGMEAAHFKLLKHDLGIDSVIEMGYHEDSGGRMLGVIVLKNSTTPQVWQALYGVAAATASYSKIIIAVDDDIDPRDMDSVAWALCYRMQPHRDLSVAQGRTAGLDPSAVPPSEKLHLTTRPQTSTLLVDATRKWGYPPTSLPAKQFMERARQIWEEEGLPTLSPKMPWYGSSLGYWPDEIAEEAELALRGDHYITGEKLAKNRIKV
ncbi:MAG: UbiD family decarboxylase [Chloroflexi bacterium]|nr:UbiD family decarboxylase [Chloroflexota bacterium]